MYAARCRLTHAESLSCVHVTNPDKAEQVFLCMDDGIWSMQEPEVCRRPGRAFGVPMARGVDVLETECHGGLRKPGSQFGLGSQGYRISSPSRLSDARHNSATACLLDCVQFQVEERADRRLAVDPIHGTVLPGSVVVVAVVQVASSFAVLPRTDPFS